MFNLFFITIMTLSGLILILTIRAIVPRYKTDVLINIVWKISLPFFLIDIFFIILFFL